LAPGYETVTRYFAFLHANRVTKRRLARNTSRTEHDFLETLVKTFIGFALGSILSLGTVTAALASGTSVAAPVSLPDDGVEVIVVTAKRPPALPVDEPVEVIVVTAKRPTQTNADRTPPAMPIVMPKLEFAAEPLVIRL
jgi:hypothetical protein